MQSSSMSNQFKVIIAGGGPAGLVAAHSLYLAGIDFTVLEARDQVSNDVGASLVLAPQSLRVMHQFGLTDALNAVGAEIDHRLAFDSHGKQFADSHSIQYIRDCHGSGPMAFHRAELIQAIYDGLPEAAKARILTNKKIDDVTSDDESVTVTCSDGTTYTASVLIGADGVHSKTRRQMRKLALAKSDPSTEQTISWDPESPYSAEYRILWGSFPLPTQPGVITETHGRDHDSTLYIAGKTRGWIFLVQKLPAKTQARVSYSDADALEYAERFADYKIMPNLTVREVIAKRLTIGMSNLDEGVIQHWSHGRIALVGDACHKYTPNGGLGFNNGIQDVVALCNGLVAAYHSSPANNPSLTTLSDVFEAYQSHRHRLAQKDYSQSALLTRVQADDTWFDYFLGHYLLWFSFVQFILLKWFAPRSVRKALVLDYVESEEPFVGKVSWLHRMKSPSGKVGPVKAKAQ